MTKTYKLGEILAIDLDGEIIESPRDFEHTYKQGWRINKEFPFLHRVVNLYILFDGIWKICPYYIMKGGRTYNAGYGFNNGFGE